VKNTVLKNLIVWAAAIVGLALVWVIAYFTVDNELLVPSFFDCMKKTGELLVRAHFWAAFFSTLKRVLFAFVISFVLAAIFSVIAYLVPTFSAFFAPIVSIFRSMPVLGVLLMLLVWTGADTAPIAVAFLSLFPLLYTGFLAALSGVDTQLLEMSRVYQVPKSKQILQLYLPTAAPQALKESGGAIAFALKLVVSAEVLASTFESIGGMMGEAKAYLDMPYLFALIFVTVVTGLLLEAVGAWLARAVERSVK
jgi:NitT/TauT family transport system permease protein